MAKDKKKNKKGKKPGKGKSAGLFSPKTVKRLDQISRNPLVADVVAATLVAAASALRDSKKAQQLAGKAGDELEELARSGAKTGNALWQLALDVGRKSLEALAGEDGATRGTVKKNARPAKSAAAGPKRSKATPKPSSRQSKRKAPSPRRG